MVLSTPAAESGLHSLYTGGGGTFDKVGGGGGG